LLSAWVSGRWEKNAARALAGHFRTLEALEKATPEELTAVRDIGAVTAGLIAEWFVNPQSQHFLQDFGLPALIRLAKKK
jgi:NAD-dependent DNA ligase